MKKNKIIIHLFSFFIGVLLFGLYSCANSSNNNSSNTNGNNTSNVSSNSGGNNTNNSSDSGDTKDDSQFIDSAIFYNVKIIDEINGNQEISIPNGFNLESYGLYNLEDSSRKKLFNGYYLDKNHLTKFDMDSPINSDLELYAEWIDLDDSNFFNFNNMEIVNGEYRLFVPDNVKSISIKDYYLYFDNDYSFRFEDKYLGDDINSVNLIKDANNIPINKDGTNYMFTLYVSSNNGLKDYQFDVVIIRKEKITISVYANDEENNSFFVGDYTYTSYTELDKEFYKSINQSFFNNYEFVSVESHTLEDRNGYYYPISNAIFRINVKNKKIPHYIILEDDTRILVYYNKPFMIDVLPSYDHDEYQFLGYYYNENNEEIQITDSSGYSIKEFKYDTDIKVYPKYRKYYVNIIVKSNIEDENLIINYENRTYHYGDDFICSIDMYDNFKYEFLGFYDAKDNLLGKDEYLNYHIDENETRDTITIVCKFKSLSYNISLNTNNNEAIDVSYNAYSRDGLVTYEICTVNRSEYIDYYFEGWFDENNNLVSTERQFYLYEISEDTIINLTAKWYLFKIENEYHGDYGTFEVGQDYVLIADNIPYDYYFLGWFDINDQKVECDDFISLKVTCGNKDQHYVAKYSPRYTNVIHLVDVDQKTIESNSYLYQTESQYAGDYYQCDLNEIYDLTRSEKDNFYKNILIGICDESGNIISYDLNLEYEIDGERHETYVLYSRISISNGEDLIDLTWEEFNSLKVGDTLSFSVNPQMEGGYEKTFIGWYASSYYDENSKLISLENDIYSVSFVLEERSYSIGAKFDNDYTKCQPINEKAGSVIVSNNNYHVKDGEFKIKAISNEGYSFLGWSKNYYGGNIFSTDIEITVINYNTYERYYAVYKWDAFPMSFTYENYDEVSIYLDSNLLILSDDISFVPKFALQNAETFLGYFDENNNFISTDLYHEFKVADGYTKVIIKSFDYRPFGELQTSYDEARYEQNEKVVGSKVTFYAYNYFNYYRGENNKHLISAFIGWYRDGELISQDFTYETLVEYGVIYEPRWIKGNVPYYFDFSRNERLIGQEFTINSQYVINTEYFISWKLNDNILSSKEEKDKNNPDYFKISTATFVMPDYDFNIDFNIAQYNVKTKAVLIRDEYEENNEYNFEDPTKNIFYFSRYETYGNLYISLKINSIDSTYIFMGWYYNDELITRKLDYKLYLPSLCKNVGENDIVLEAKYIINQIEIRDNSVSIIDKQAYCDYVYGETYQIEALINEDEGYYPSYWQISKDNGAFEKYCDGSILTFTLNEEKVTYRPYYENRKNCAHNYENCVCTICGKTNHDINENTHVCTVCNTYFHKLNDDCFCSIHNQYEHDKDNNCYCSRCKKVIHKVDENCFCNSCLKTIHNTSSTYCRHDDIIYMGSYPQSRVTDKNILKNLSKLTPKISFYKNEDESYSDFYSLWEPYEKISEFASYSVWKKDIVYNDEKYLAVYFNGQYKLGTDAKSFYGYHLDDVTANNIYYFKYEPISWKIVSEEDNKLTLQANSAFDAYVLSLTYGIDYRNSVIRDYLNNEFINKVFTEEERNLIVPSTINTKGVDNGSWAYRDDYNLNDKIYLPTISELKETSPSSISEFVNFITCDNGLIMSRSRESYVGSMYKIKCLNTLTGGIYIEDDYLENLFATPFAPRLTINI